MDIRTSSELMKKYAVCPECGSDKIGGKPSSGALIIEDEVFTRSCACGWSVSVDKRIKYVASCTFKRGRKTDGVIEVRIHKFGPKYLPLLELKEKSGIRSINHSAKIEDWLNSPHGREWALSVKPAALPI